MDAWRVFFTLVNIYNMFCLKRVVYMYSLLVEEVFIYVLSNRGYILVQVVTQQTRCSVQWVKAKWF